MEYITRPQFFRVEGILIHVHPTAKGYPEDPTTVEVEEYIIDHEDGGSVNVGRPTKTWFDKWYDELYRVPRQGNASHLFATPTRRKRRRRRQRLRRRK